jgi:hypothetical protein
MQQVQSKVSNEELISYKYAGNIKLLWSVYLLYISLWVVIPHIHVLKTVDSEHR